MGDEVREGAVRDRGAIDEEGVELDLVRDELVVVRPRLVGRAEDERAAVHPYLVGAVGDVSVRALVANRVLDLGPELERLQHRLLVLQLVLEHQPEDEAFRSKGPGPSSSVCSSASRTRVADVGRVRPRGLGVGEAGAATAPFRASPKAVWTSPCASSDRRLTVEVAEEPELLEVRDARELPHERQLERRHVLGEPFVRHRREERVGRRSGPIERGLDLDDGFHTRTLHDGCLFDQGPYRGL